MEDKNFDEDNLTQIIIKYIQEKKPKNIQQLINLMKEKHSFPEEQIIKHVLQLQNQGKIKLQEIAKNKPSNFGGYLITKDARWYWIVLLLATITIPIVHIIPENYYPFAYLRIVFGLIFILWLPGYSFVRAIFTVGHRTKKFIQPLNPIERTAFTLVTNLAIDPLVGLILNYTPWGVRLTPITLCLLTITVVLSTVAIIREYKIRSATQQIDTHTIQ
jgi:hypothetical protein